MKEVVAVHSSGDSGCHKVPPPAGESASVDVEEAAPEMGVYLLARLRMYIVASLFRDEPDGGSPAVAS